MIFNSRIRRAAAKRGEDGYVLLTLLLIVALMVVAALAVVPEVKFQVQRDREEEMIHRGVQYTRAIRAYYKKFGRYPTRLEDLDNSNNLRFLRKHYKDPVTGQDFKLLHFGEAKLSATSGIGGIGGGGIPGANSLNGAGGFGAQPGGGLNSGGINGPGGSSGGFGSSGFNSGSSFGSSSSGFGASGSNAPNANNPQGQGTSSISSTDPSQSSSTSSNGTSSNGQPGQPGQPGASGDQLSGKVFGGGPIVGVASRSKDSGYREFNHKKKYEDWQFVYDPATDRGGLITTPNQPGLQGFGQSNIPGAKPAALGNGNNTDTGQPPQGMQNGNPSLNGPPGPPQQQN